MSLLKSSHLSMQGKVGRQLSSGQAVFRSSKIQLECIISNKGASAQGYDLSMASELVLLSHCCKKGLLPQVLPGMQPMGPVGPSTYPHKL